MRRCSEIRKPGPQKKPDPSVIQYCLGALNVGQLMQSHVGDSSINVEAAKGAGVAAWAWSYGSNGGRPIQDTRPDHVFQTLADVACHVLAWRMAA